MRHYWLGLVFVRLGLGGMPVCYSGVCLIVDRSSNALMSVNERLCGRNHVSGSIDMPFVT